MYDDRGVYVPEEGARGAGGWVVRDEGCGEGVVLNGEVGAGAVEKVGGGGS